MEPARGVVLVVLEVLDVELVPVVGVVVVMGVDAVVDVLEVVDAGGGQDSETDLTGAERLRDETGVPGGS